MCSVTLGSYIYSIYPIKATETPTWLSRITFQLGIMFAIGYKLRGFYLILYIPFKLGVFYLNADIYFMVK
jgi:hypothetical protein